jgi:hypothetical protein
LSFLFAQLLVLFKVVGDHAVPSVVEIKVDKNETERKRNVQIGKRNGHALVWAQKIGKKPKEIKGKKENTRESQAKINKRGVIHTHTHTHTHTRTHSVTHTHTQI